MIFSGNTQVYIYTGCVDMRNSIDGLSAKVQRLMGKNPFTGDLFVFSNRYHNMIKVLYWHTNGFCLWMKRLEKGRFKWPKPTADMFCVHLCCMAHARRKFNDALKALDKCNLEKEEIRTSIANQATNLIAKLYAVEKEIRTREGELDKSEVVRNFRITTKHGAIEDKTQTHEVQYYNLDVIISVGYRVKSLRGTQFRQWATKRLNEYIRKGFTLDDNRLKQLGGGGYWSELLSRIRDIRSSEKVFYRQILDIYATSIDYNPRSDTSIEFFKKVQNKIQI